MITDATSKGASVLLGGAPCQPGDLKGYFMQPTILSNVTPEAQVTREETFAPVVALYSFKTEEEVIERANDCDVGLGSYVLTESISRMWRVAESLEVGMVGVNLGVLSACESPFGGVKESGTSSSGMTRASTHGGTPFSFFALLRSATCVCSTINSVVSSATRCAMSVNGGSDGCPDGANAVWGTWNLNSIVSNAVLFLARNNEIYSHRYILRHTSSSIESEWMRT